MNPVSMKKFITLSNTDQQLAENEIKHEKKSVGLYVFFFLVTGIFGGHHVYMSFQKGNTKSFHMLMVLLYLYLAGTGKATEMGFLIAADIAFSILYFKLANRFNEVRVMDLYSSKEDNNLEK